MWTGSEMIIWGGNGGLALNDGGRYHPAENTWKAMTTLFAPAARHNHTALWTGNEMLVWGGWDGTRYFNDTFNYFPDCGIFRITSAVLDSGNLKLSFPSVMGHNYTLWRSDSLAGGPWTNTGLPALAGTGATLTFTVPATTAARRFFRVQSGP